MTTIYVCIESTQYAIVFTVHYSQSMTWLMLYMQYAGYGKTIRAINHWVENSLKIIERLQYGNIGIVIVSIDKNERNEKFSILK